MKPHLPLAISLALAAFPAHAQDGAIDNDDLRSEAEAYFESIPDTPVSPDGTELTAERVNLGAMLFFDPRMSRSGLFSCQSCHNVGMGGVDGLETSIGHGWQQGPRNSPTVLNAVFNIAQFWDGRAPDLAAQAKGPVQAGVEMNNTPDNLIATLISMPGYVDAFKAAYPDQVDPISFDNFADAIGAFEATLITPGSRFDRFLTGDNDAMTEQEKRGLLAFMDTGCAGCHGGVNFGGQDYYPFGLIERPGGTVLPEGDRGRFTVTETASDEYVFRAAPLRNIALTAPYFHSGVVWDLAEAVEVMSTAQLGTELSDDQVADIVAFLGTLTGEQLEVPHPVLPVRATDTPRPEPMFR